MYRVPPADEPAASGPYEIKQPKKRIRSENDNNNQKRENIQNLPTDTPRKTSETSADGWNHAAAIQSMFVQRFYASGPYKIK